MQLIILKAYNSTICDVILNVINSRKISIQMEYNLYEFSLLIQKLGLSIVYL